MKHYGLKIAEGSEVTNLTAPTGTAFPTQDLNDGELFFRTDLDKLYVYNESGTNWVDTTAGGLAAVVDDTSPQLGANLDLNTYSIVGKPAADATSAGGDVNILAADGGVTSGDGGNVTISGGNAGAGATDGTITLTGETTINAVSGGNTGKLYLEGGIKTLYFYDSDTTADQKKFRIHSPVASYLEIGTSNDAENGGSTSMRFHRSGGGISHIETFDPLRSQNGTSGQPHYSFTNATNAGMYYDSTAVGVGIAIASQQMFIVTANGLRIKDATAPSTDTTGYHWLYVDSADNGLKFRDEAGTVTDLLAGGGISNVVEDTTPQLGGELDMNGQDISMPSGSAINGAPNVSLIGEDTGTTFGGNILAWAGDGTTIGGSVDIRAGNSPTSGGNIDLAVGYGTTSNTTGVVKIQCLGGTEAPKLEFREKSVGGSANWIRLKAPDDTNNNRTWVLPQDDPSTASGQFLTTDASGNLSFAAAGGGEPAGTGQEIQFNDGGSPNGFGASSNLTWNGSNIQVGGAGQTSYANGVIGNGGGNMVLTAGSQGFVTTRSYVQVVNNGGVNIHGTNGSIIAANSDGGDITITGGTGDGTGVDGSVILESGNNDFVIKESSGSYIGSAEPDVIGVGPGNGAFTFSNGDSGVTGVTSHLALESSGFTKFGIYSTDANSANLDFGTPGDTSGAGMTWNYGTAGANKEFKIGTKTTGGKLILAYDNYTDGLTIESTGLVRVHGDLDVQGNTILLDDNVGLLSDTGATLSTGPTGGSWHAQPASDVHTGFIVKDHTGRNLVQLAHPTGSPASYSTRFLNDSGSPSDVALMAFNHTTGQLVVGDTASDALGAQSGSTTISTGNSGVTSVSAQADDFIVEGSDNTGISILSPNNKYGIVYFGDPEDNDVAAIRYAHFSNTMSFITSGVVALEIQSDGVLNVGNIADYETLVTLDDDIPNKKYVDDAATLVTTESFYYTATASQTTFTGTDNNGDTLAYVVGGVYVYLNGVLLDPSDYTATNGTSVVLDTGATLNDVVTIVSSASSTGALSTSGGTNLTGGFTTDVEVLTSNTITPDYELPALKTRAVTGNVTINSPTTGNGACYIKLAADASGPYTVTLGTGVTAVGTIPDLAASTTYVATVIRFGASDTYCQIQEAG